MSVFLRLFNFYINSSIHVALAAYSLTRITEVYFELPYNETLDYVVFFGTITGYNFVKYYGIAKFHHRSLASNLKIIQIFSLICFILLVYYGIQLALKTLLLYVLFGLLTVLYAIPFLSGFQKSLRAFSYLKIIVVVFVWAGVTVLIPVLDSELSTINAKLVFSFLQRFLILAVLIFPFDIRDLQYDAISLQTVPQKIGVKQTKKLGFVLMLGALFLEFLLAPNDGFRNIFLVFFFSVIFLLMRSKTKQSKYFSSFWVEALPIFWCLLLFAMLSF